MHRTVPTEETVATVRAATGAQKGTDLQKSFVAELPMASKTENLHELVFQVSSSIPNGRRDTPFDERSNQAERKKRLDVANDLPIADSWPAIRTVSHAVFNLKRNANDSVHTALVATVSDRDC